jgi:hypothetical protein
MTVENNERHSSGGKGDSPRPTNHKLYAANYDKIFGNKKVDNTDSSDIIGEVESNVTHNDKSE